MMNKDYILRLAERLGRELSIILGLRQRDQHEEALIYIDDLLFKNVGLTSSFLNSLPEDMLLKALSPLGPLNVDACLWVATLLQQEGEIYEHQGNSSESYYRSTRALFLFLEVFNYEPTSGETPLRQNIQQLLQNLADYELPPRIQQQLIVYYEQSGQYDKAENILFDLLESAEDISQVITEGKAFYTRLQRKSDADLQAGNLSRTEVMEGLEQLQLREQ